MIGQQRLFNRSVISTLKVLSSFKLLTEYPKSLFFQRKFKWVLSIAITTVNYLLTYSSFHLDLVHVYFFVSDLFLTLLILEFYILCIRCLNKWIPWGAGYGKRLIIQLSLITPIVVLFTIFVNEALEVIIYTNRIGVSFYTFDMIIAVLFILVVQLLYTSLHFIHQKTSLAPTSSSFVFQIKVSCGKSSKILIEPDIIAAFVDVDTNITYVLDKAFKKFICHKPLRELEEKLPQRFYRANRQFIVSKDLINTYKSLEYGKILVGLNHTNTPLPEYIIVSRKKASHFRRWIGTDF
ncbi:LytTR family DNA-binding domain-containing protein [Fulvivirgaceae bacterium BMA10]|uniref:LytTR family DNA-binding domain-containing protein n=1 Tax=Splendidivirga corallicola TaxID=3051826 RepID=A0ABT8KMD6_9BACT|nr:LytTR family DNA-binding domain-containing protein [Fulvivirgaceae bacterium BMA10]